MRKLNVLRWIMVLAFAAQITILPAWQIGAYAAEGAGQEDEYALDQEETGSDTATEPEATAEPEAAAETDAATESETAEESDTATEPDTETGSEVAAEPETVAETETEAKAAAEESVTVTEETLEKEEADAGMPDSPEALLEDYLNNRLYGTQNQAVKPGGKMLFRSATRPLTGFNARIYEAALAEIKKVADGESSSSRITIYIDGFLDQTSYTAGELGLDTIYDVTTVEETGADGEPVTKYQYSLKSEARQALFEKIGWSARKVMNYLMTNCPYELYWYDKTQDYYHSLTISYTAPEETLTIPDNARIILYLPVSKDYAGEEDYTLDTDKTGTASKAVEYAHEIVSAAADLSDWDKLVAYKDAIMSLVSYDSSAAWDGTDYGDPWQIINVFDRDSSTNVVCEGYSKAFQYLCDLTTWNREIECHTVRGILDVEGNNHMWNVVSLWDGCNFAVDLTNCDSDGSLFMVGTEDYADGTYTLNDGEKYYEYDADMAEVYTEESIRITSLKAHDPHYYEGMEPEFVWDEENKTCKAAVVCGLCDEVHYFDTEVTSSDGPKDGQIQYTAVFYAEDHSFTDTLILEKEEESSAAGTTKESEDSTAGKTGDKPEDSTSSDTSSESGSGSSAKESETQDSADANKGSDQDSPKVGDRNAEETRTLIGTIILCLMGIGAAVLILRRNRDQIKELFTDENGRFNPIGGLERHFAQGAEDETAQETDPEDTTPDEDFMSMLYRQKGVGMAQLDPERDAVREHIIFHGRVQGVGFRYQAMFAARSFDLTGWVENLPDGSVEMEVQGTPLGIGRMMKHLQSGHWIRIDDMDVENIPLVDGERGFGVRGY